MFIVLQNTIFVRAAEQGSTSLCYVNPDLSGLTCTAYQCASLIAFCTFQQAAAEVHLYKVSIATGVDNKINNKLGFKPNDDLAKANTIIIIFYPRP